MSIELPALGSRVGGRYDLIDVRGAGMMGVVYRARDAADGTEVALKVLRPEALRIEGVAARLEQEAQIVARLQSPHLVRVLELSRTKAGLPFLAMELLSGETLAQRLSSRKTLTVPEAVSVVIQACDAIVVAHDAGVVHRDLKPDNLFLARTPGGEIVKVLDFGVSKLYGAGADLTTIDASLGTPLYMSPEQVRSSRDVDERSDVWALGVILYELLIGETPFEHSSASAACAAIVADPVPAVGERRADVPIGLSRVIGEALTKDRHKRLRSARLLRDALVPYLTATTSRATAPAALSSAAGPLANRGDPRPEGAVVERISRRQLALGVGAGLAFALLLGLAGFGLWRRSHGDTRPIGESLGIASGQHWQDLVAADPAPTRKSKPCLLSGPQTELLLEQRAGELVVPLAGLDQELATGVRRLSVITPWLDPLAKPAAKEALYLVPQTPLFAALRRGPLALVVVTPQSVMVGVSGGEVKARDMTFAELGASLDTHVPGAPGVVVGVDAQTPSRRLSELLVALDQADKRIVLASVTREPPSREVPVVLPFGCSARPLPAEPLTGSDRMELMEGLEKLEHECTATYPEAAGTTLRGLARINTDGRVELCVSGEEYPSVRLRNCVVGEGQKARLTPAREARMLAFSLTFDLDSKLRARCR